MCFKQLLLWPVKTVLISSGVAWAAKNILPCTPDKSQPVTEAEGVQWPVHTTFLVPCPTRGSPWGCPFSRNSLQCGCGILCRGIHSQNWSLMACYNNLLDLYGGACFLESRLFNWPCTQIVPEFNLFSHLDLHLVDLVSLFFLNRYKDEKMQVCVLLFYCLQNHFSSSVLVLDAFFSCSTLP